MASAPTATFDERLTLLWEGDPEALANPIELYNELRERAPVYEFRGIVLVSEHADAKEVTRDATRFSSTKGAQSRRGQEFRASLEPAHQAAFDEVSDIESKWLTRVGGEEHVRLRSAAHRAFTPRRIAELDAATRTYVDALVDELLAADGTSDLMPLAFRVPLMVVSDLLGAPKSDWEQIYRWSRRIGANLGSFRLETLLDAHAAYGEFARYVDEMLDGQRTGKGANTDLVSALVNAEHEQRLTTQELVSMYIVLLFAGHETTTNLIGTGLYELLRNPEQWQELATDPSHSGAAVEELLRIVSPIQWNLRQAAVATTIHDHPIEAGQDVQVILAAANRDPEVFDRPDVLDIDRADAGDHLAFGYGAHFCLGSALARLEATIVLETLATRFPDLELVDEPMAWEGSANLRRLSRLPVRLGAQRVSTS